MKQKNIILFVGKVYDYMIEKLKEYEEQTNQDYRVGIIFDQEEGINERTKEIEDEIDIKIPCDTDSMSSIQKSLLPYQEELFAITSRGSANVSLFSKFIPHVPYLKTPTPESLFWSTHKLYMRKRFKNHNKSLVPKFLEATDSSNQTLSKIKEKIGFPIVVKPTGLASSKFVNFCSNKKETKTALNKIFNHIQEIYKENKGNWDPDVIVEDYMEGEMYSVDGYVDCEGNIKYCPLVENKTGRDIGFDDFFDYLRITPTELENKNKEKVLKTTTEATHALGLRNTTIHAELMLTKNGWKIIEIGPRIGGSRGYMYKKSFGINHMMNDVLNRTNGDVSINKKSKGYSGSISFYPKNEGELKKIHGLTKIKSVDSVDKINKKKETGEKCLFAKNGGSGALNIYLFNKSRKKLMQDIELLEEEIKIEVRTN